MQHFTSINDVPNPDALIQWALEIKRGNIPISQFPNNRKTLVSLFFNPSLRPRVSTEKAASSSVQLPIAAWKASKNT